MGRITEIVTSFEERIQYLNDKCFEFQQKKFELEDKVDELEDKIKELQNENAELYERIEALENKEEEDKIDLERIRKIIEKARRMKIYKENKKITV
jgi:peptidoglycan hydrolase CwlO-like protein